MLFQEVRKNVVSTRHLSLFQKSEHLAWNNTIVSLFFVLADKNPPLYFYCRNTIGLLHIVDTDVSHISFTAERFFHRLET